MTRRGPSIGDELPGRVREATLHHWNRYAAVNDEFVDIHMDDDAGRAAGYPAAIGMGNLQWSYLHEILREWIGDQGRIESVTCRFRGASIRGSLVATRGVVTSVDEQDGQVRVEVDVWTEDAAGDRLADGTATVLLADAFRPEWTNDGPGEAR